MVDHGGEQQRKLHFIELEIYLTCLTNCYCRLELSVAYVFNRPSYEFAKLAICLKPTYLVHSHMLTHICDVLDYLRWLVAMQVSLLSHYLFHILIITPGLQLLSTAQIQIISVLCFRRWLVNMLGLTSLITIIQCVLVGGTATLCLIIGLIMWKLNGLEHYVNMKKGINFLLVST